MVIFLKVIFYRTHPEALPANTRLLGCARTAIFAHVLAEVALHAVVARARLTLLAPHTSTPVTSRQLSPGLHLGRSANSQKLGSLRLLFELDEFLKAKFEC